MKQNTKVIAYKRLLENKATKAELKVLIKWAETEINEWAEFLKVCDKRLKDLES